jgi:predicted nuclease of predicted toxin-antitoxin system
VKFLVDNALSPRVSEALSKNDFEAVHVREIGLQHAKDKEIFKYAEENGLVIISADTDFSFILSNRQTDRPSLILFRDKMTKKPTEQIEFLINHLHELQSELREGSIISIRANRVRVRKLPLY